MNWWDVEIDLHIRNGANPDNARNATIIWWMLSGDFRPLGAAIWEGHKIDDALTVLAMMIREGRLKAVLPHCKGRSNKGRPNDRSKIIRGYLSEMAYNVQTGKSDKKFEEIAAILKWSESNVRQAVTAWRKRNNK